MSNADFTFTTKMIFVIIDSDSTLENFGHALDKEGSRFFFSRICRFPQFHKKEKNEIKQKIRRKEIDTA